MRRCARAETNSRSAPRDEESTRLLREGGWLGRIRLWSRDVIELLEWMRSCNMHVKFASWGMALVGNLMLNQVRQLPCCRCDAAAAVTRLQP